MRVLFALDALNDNRSWKDLDRIVDVLFDEDHPDDERHLWEIDDIDALLGSAWLDPPEHWRSQNTREIAERTTLAMATVPRGRRMHSLKVVVTNTSDAEDSSLQLAPRRALEVLREPLHVVVENNQSDGAFVETMARVFGHRDLLLALARRWCVFMHAGGSGELHKRVEERLGANVLPQRICVITDGDRLSPSVEVDPRAAALQQSCRASGVACFVLHKRDSENYLPVEILALHEASDRLTTFCRLTQAQRDHFDMKKGFRDRPADDPAYGDLYANLGERRRAALADGFGKNIGELFKNKRLDFRRDHVERTCATADGELPALLDALERML